jgi:hypothetical protein
MEWLTEQPGEPLWRASHRPPHFASTLVRPGVRKQAAPAISELITETLLTAYRLLLTFSRHPKSVPTLLLVLQPLPRGPGLRVVLGMSQIAHFRADNRPFLFFQAGSVGIKVTVHDGGLNEDQ